MKDILFNEDDGVEYDPLYNEILLLLSGYDSADSPVDAPENNSVINWSDISEKCSRLLVVCKDLRVMMWRLRADLRTQGVAALYETLREIDSLLTSGERLYPHIPDEPAGCSHAAALGWLSAGVCMSELKAARLASGQSLTFGGLVQTLIQEGDVTVSFSELIVILGKAAESYQEQDCPVLLAQLLFCAEALTRIEHYANQHSDDYQLDCRGLRKLLMKTHAQLAELSSKEIDETVENDLYEAPALSLISGQGKIKSRQDAILMLDKIIDYFKTYEPSHPAPIFIRRSQKLIGMEFGEIIEELMPEASDTLAKFTGTHQA
ncbi:ImpA family type VI secretion system protein [Pantoea endophytica]|uniref:type VI secretion system protein TssA n=1 Tax=Pantoea endophytica TaxID=92488 RepID=UPI0030191E4D